VCRRNRKELRIAMRLDNIRSKCECPEKLDLLISCWRRIDDPKAKQDWRLAQDTEIGVYFCAEIRYSEKVIFKFELESKDRGPRSKVLSDFSRLKLGGVPEEILGPHQERIKQFLLKKFEGPSQRRRVTRAHLLLK